MAQEVHSLIQELVDYIKINAPKKDQALLQKFVQTYFVSVALDELATRRKIPEIYAILYAHFRFIQKRKEGEIKLKVYNPTAKEDGYTTTHTIVELVQDDMPFIVDSLVMELNRQGIVIHFIAHSGGIWVERDKSGNLKAFSLEPIANCMPEANVYIVIDRQHEESSLEALHHTLMRILHDVGLVVEGFHPMKKALVDYLKHLENFHPYTKAGKLDEVIAFLKWLSDDHFTFLGFAEFTPSSGKKMTWKCDTESATGLMSPKSTYGLECFIDEFASEVDGSKTEPLIITKSSYVSNVHRPVWMDVIMVREFNEQGEVIKEGRFLGLYTSSAYHTHTQQIPYLRKKVHYVFDRAHLPSKSHDAKALEDIIESFPKDELFQISKEELFNMVMGILHIQERQQIRLFMRQDIFKRFYSCMVYLPRDLFNTELRQKFQNILMGELHGKSSSFVPKFLLSILCRIDFLINTDPKDAIKPDIRALEEELRAAARNWRDDLKVLLLQRLGEHHGNFVYNKYARAFSSSYRDDFSVETVLVDIAEIEHLLEVNENLTIDLERDEKDMHIMHLKLMQCHHGLWLTHVLPILEDFGLKVIEERPYEIKLANELSVWLSDFLIDASTFRDRFDELRTLFKEAFLEVWRQKAENDGFNRLILSAGLTVREVVILRAIAKYLAQIGFVYSQKYVEDTLVHYPELTSLLVQLFVSKFNLSASTKDAKEFDEIVKHFNQGLTVVSNLDHDRIIRRFKDVIKAMIRTNYYQKDEDGHYKACVSFKLSPALIPDMPSPVPLAEIFVYAPEVEGVHLRGAKVSRGGIRWSDRREDFRTEVLGLMKAQQVKNAVIVPLGAKGGFYPKKLPVHEGTDAIQAEAIRCYQIYISALLDITDNIVDNKVVPPVDVVRYDGDDPYFVVAADKGTATFSDIANALSAAYNFWLGDAFASGGSFGYDHKKMGITARGAWESVKRHFLFLNKDIQKEDFTCMGIGDMSGDVFGNGMLLSKHTKLVAAFNHKHIFLDPNPEIGESYKERQRLFKLGRSGWNDYNSKLISKGGGVYERSLKIIPLSPEVKEALAITQDELEPNGLIRAILKAPIELLWNGGIGTYVKASTETNQDVGDRANDVLRINATDLRCKVVGEGGNLGFTQLARIEFALNGGQICTDAIDNSAGVDCSDHEVNIKILLNEAMRQNLLDLDQRNSLLAAMEQEVGALVLSDNYHQTQVISNGISQISAGTTYIRVLRELERENFINRTLEALPGDKVLRARIAQNKSFTKPEFSVLMAYVKNTIKEIVIRSDLPDDPYFERYLVLEFPKVLSDKYVKAMRNHPLRHEIIITQLINQLVQYLGIAYVHRMYDEVGASPVMSCRAFAAALELFDIEKIWQEIEALDGKVPATVQIGMMNEITNFLQHQCRWLLTHYRLELDVKEVVKYFKEGCEEIFKVTRHYLNNDQRTFREQMISNYCAQGAPQELAERVADFYYLYSTFDMIHTARENKIELTEMISTYYALSQNFGLSWLRQKLNEIALQGYWDMLTASSLKDRLNRYQAILVINIINSKAKGRNVSDRIKQWAEQYRYFVNRWYILFEDFKISTQEFSRFSTLINCLRDLTETCCVKEAR
jgi:glutamate dehydrogenase